MKIKAAERPTKWHKVRVEREDGSIFIVEPAPKAFNEEVEVKDGYLWMGNYRYNTENDTWEKISKILSFLKGIVDLIKNIFQ